MILGAGGGGGGGLGADEGVTAGRDGAVEKTRRESDTVEAPY